MNSSATARRPSSSRAASNAQRPTEAHEKASEPEAKTRPFHVLERYPLKAVIWENETQNGPMFSIQLIRIFKQDEYWRETSSLNASDLLPAAKLLEEADARIVSEERSRRQQARNADRQS